MLRPARWPGEERPAHLQVGRSWLREGDAAQSHRECECQQAVVAHGPLDEIEGGFASKAVRLKVCRREHDALWLGPPRWAVSDKLISAPKRLKT